MSLLSPSLLASLATGFTLSASLIVAIGAQNAFVLRQGLRREHVAAVAGVCALLDVALMSLGVAGFGAAVARYPQLLRVAGLCGAVALAAYGLGAFRRALAPGRLAAAEASGAARPVGEVVAKALGISLLNPQVYLDTVVLVGAVGASQPEGTRAGFLLGASLASTLWFAALAFGARALSPLFARPAAWRMLDAGVGLTMFAIAWRLAREALGG